MGLQLLINPVLCGEDSMGEGGATVENSMVMLEAHNTCGGMVQFREMWPVERRWKHNPLSMILIALASGSSFASVRHFSTRW